MGSDQDGCTTKEKADRASNTYNSMFLVIYLFNVIVVSGPLILPKAISSAGLVLGPFVLLFVAGMSYVTATYVVEAMGIANAYARFRSRRDFETKLMPHTPSPTLSDIIENSPVEKGGGMDENEDHLPIVCIPIITANHKEESNESTRNYQSCCESDIIFPEDYEITEKFEMGGMANLFFPTVGITLYYIVVCLYLYLGLAFLLVTISLCLVTVTCSTTDYLKANTLDSVKENFSENLTAATHFDLVDALGQFSPDSVCFHALTQQQTYYICLSVTAVFICAWTYFNFTASRYLQFITTILRTVAIGVMVSIAIARLAQGDRTNSPPPPVRISGFPIIFGVSNFISKCQHSLPGMVTPMKSKKGLSVMLLVPFITAQALYFVLYFTAIMSVPQHELLDLYTLNFFKPFHLNDSVGGHVLSVIGYFLAVFPVFSLGTVFPIISVTLRENIKDLAHVVRKNCMKDKPFPYVVNHLLFSTLTVFPPLVIAFATTKVVLVASVTGSLLGVWLQYLFPAMFVLTGKHIIEKKLKKGYKNKYASPFSHNVILILIIVWTVASVLWSLTEYVLKITQHLATMPP